MVLTPPETVVVSVTSSTVINVDDGATAPVLVGQPTVTVIEVMDRGGPQGPPGPAGSMFGTEFTQSVPAATWILAIPAEFTRRPTVSLYDASGEEVEADVFVSSGTVTVIFPAPFAGTAVLN